MRKFSLYFENVSKQSFFCKISAFANLYNNTSGESSTLQFLIQFHCQDLKCQNQKLWPQSRKCTKLKELMLVVLLLKKWWAWRFALGTWTEGQVFVSPLSINGKEGKPFWSCLRIDRKSRNHCEHCLATYGSIRTFLVIPTSFVFYHRIIHNLWLNKLPLFLFLYSRPWGYLIWWT